MGNASSSEEPEEQSLLEAAGSGEEEAGSDEEGLLNFSSFFQPESLYKALLAIKEPPGSAISRNKEGMVQWLSGLADKEEHTVNMVQVVEHLIGRGVSTEEALEFFSEVDRDSEGQVDIAYLLMVLKEKTVDPMQALVPCHLMPGPLEVYLANKCSQSQMGNNLVQFLQRRRVEPASIVIGCMGQIIAHQLTREKLVQGRHQMLLSRHQDNSLLEDGVGDDGSDLQKRVVVSKCYSKIETSSSQLQIHNLTDNRSDTFWQSSGSPRSHWIRLLMLSGIAVRELAVSVDMADDSYMPRTIVVSAGNSEKHLSDIKTVHIPRHKTGSVVLVKNLGRVYQYVQINIRACHSDGCDVKIREIHVKGSKVQEQKQPSVLDTMAVWYINLLAATAKAAIPVAPHLKDALKAHSRSALNSLQPLVLSPSSPARPEFLSSFVLEEMQHMLETVNVPDEVGETIEPQSLEILLAFSIAHGNVNAILDCLYLLLDHQNVNLNILNLLQRLEEVKMTKYLKHAKAVQLKVASCSGGCKDGKHEPDNVLTNDLSSGSAVPYVSANNHKTVTLVLRQKDGMVISPTRLLVQVPSSENAAQSCLIFLLAQEPSKAWLKELTHYEGSGKEQYHKWLRERDGLIAQMEFSKDTLQVETTPALLKSGRSLVMVFSVSGEEVESVAVQVVNVYGHCSPVGEADNEPFLKELDSNAPLPLEGGVAGGVVLCHVLVFVSVLLQDLSKLVQLRHLASLEPSLITEPHLGVEGLSLEKIWKLYAHLSSLAEVQAAYPSLLALWLLKSALPFITADKAKKDGQRPSHDSSAILSHLCAVLDAEGGDKQLATQQLLAQDIVGKGVVVFFPDSTAQKEYLLGMVESVLSEKQPRSWWLKFEALCQYFSKTDTNSLLELPGNISEGEVETKRAMELMTTMLTVALRESQISLSSGKSRPDNLVNLLCALQASLFFWCRRNIATEAGQGTLLKYVENLVTCSTKVLREITAIEADVREERLKPLDRSLLTRPLAEMLIFLPTITKSTLPRPRLMDTLYPLVPALHAATTSCPGIFLKLTEAGSLVEQQESVVGVWTRESPHNYENNARVTEEFVCPSATKFVIEFDPRCITERRYDYLEFTDVTGAKHKFDGKFNSERWARTAEFPGPKLQFLFHSDGSNNEWGYLFTLKAYGQPAPSFHWLFDLQLSLARLLGQLTSATLAMKTLYTKLPKQREEALLTRSEVWRTLFRGGYMLRKLTRSLSGAHVASPADSKLNSQLHDLAGGAEGIGRQLLESLREQRKGPYYGGEQVDLAVNAVFAALIWHCQDLREELTCKESSHQPSQLLQEAFSTAEALRRELVEARQKVLEAKEKEESEDKKSQMNEDSPLVNCREKAIFLLKFAGLSRVSHDGEEGVREEVDSQSNAISTVGRLKQQLSLGGQARPSFKRPVSFGLVLNFVKNDSATKDKVHDLLQEREKLASCVAQVYTSAATYLSAITIDNMFELPGLVFLQQLLSLQRHFPIHYAAKLDGCGLDLENEVRKAYRLLLQRLMEGLAAFSRPPSVEYARAHVLVSIITCHLLDCQWLDYDHHLIADLHLPDFLLESAIRSTQCEEKEKVVKFEGEDEMIACYAILMKLQERDKELGGNNVEGLQKLEVYQENTWEGELYISAKKWPASVHVSVQCDSCQNLIKRGLFYHNMDLKSTSYDLCPQCFKSGDGPRPDEHTLDQLYLAMGRFYCNNCHLYITTHRFHSNTRDDFDLCLGCFRKEEEARGSSHDKWTVFLLTEGPLSGSGNRFKTCDPGTSKPVLYSDGYLVRAGPALDLMFYLQHHCWLLFTALCLSMAHCLNTGSSSNSGSSDRSYKAQACRNLLQCLRHLARLLQTAVVGKWEEDEARKVAEKKDGNGGKMIKSDGDTGKETLSESTGSKTTSNGVAMETNTPPTSDEDLITQTSHQRCRDGSKPTAMEKTFSILNLSTSLYTLAAVLPQDSLLCVWCEEVKDEVEKAVGDCLLPALLEVTACTAVQPLTRQLALIVTAQYMARLSPQVADRSIEIARGQSPSVKSDEEGGLLTTKYYFSLGAGFLQRSDFSGAATIAECLLILSRATEWKEAVSQSVLSPLSTKAEEMDLSSIFGLMVLAGFPKLHREGSLVQVHSSDQRQSVSVLTSVQGESGTVVCCESREPQTVKLSRCEVEDTLRGCITFSQLPSLLPLLHHCIQLARQEDDRQVEATWILALTLKALHVLIMGPESEAVVKAFLKEGLLPDVSRLACRATRLTQKWLASDLEVVAVRSYQPVDKRESGDEAGAKEVSHDSEAVQEKQEKKEEDEGKKEKRAEEACLEGLSDEIQDMLVIMQEAFQCPLTTLRALFDASGADVNQFIMSSEQYYDLESATLKPPDDILEAASKWESEVASVDHEVRDIQGSLEDTGVTRLIPVPCSLACLEAEPEKTDVMKRPKSLELMQDDLQQEEEEMRQGSAREDSFQLLQERLKGGVASRKELVKMQQAIVVLYARHVLAALISHWPHPPHPRFSTSLLGNMDIMQFFCLLDLLIKPLSQQACSNLLGGVVERSEPTQLVSLAVKASEAMRRVSVGVEKRQFQATSQATAEEGKVVIPNASSMSIAFSQTRGEVELASNEDFCDHLKISKSSETNTEREITHLIPGNTVHYRVKLEPGKEAKHTTFTLTITGTQMGRFSTGLRFLEQLLSEAGEGERRRALPLSQLWPNLIAVACHHTGRERLKVIHLLLHLLSMMKDSTGSNRPDLSALKPLWQFYCTTLVKDYDAKNRSQQVIAPHILRALTELFLHVENQAQEWGVAQTMVIETLTKESLGTWLEKGISNVAFLSLGLGLDNAASTTFLEARRSYVPPEQDSGREEEKRVIESSSENSLSDSMSDSSENSFDTEES